MSNFSIALHQHLQQYEQSLRIAIAAYDETSTASQIERHITQQLEDEMNRFVLSYRTPPTTHPSTPDAPILGRRRSAMDAFFGPDEEEQEPPLGARRRRLDALFADSDDEEEPHPNPEIVDLTMDSDTDTVLTDLTDEELPDVTGPRFLQEELQPQERRVIGFVDLTTPTLTPRTETDDETPHEFADLVDETYARLNIN